MKVLFVTVNAGQGHNATCDAVMCSLQAQDVQCKKIDFLSLISPLLSDTWGKAYVGVAKYAPGAYDMFYTLGERTVYDESERSLVYALCLLPCDKLREAITEYKPDVIVSSHVFPALALTHLRKNGHVPAALVGIVTDYTIHPYWEETQMDMLVTASPQLDYQLSAKGIPANIILPIGIPVHPKFSVRLPRQGARAMLGLDDMPVILIMTGSMGYGGLKNIITALDTLAYPFRMLVICGRNSRGRSAIARMSHLKHSVTAYGYVDNVDIFMDAADLLVTKPGGLSTSEAIAKQLPMLLVDPIPGQEVRNADFLVNSGLAVYGGERSPAEYAARLLADPERLSAMRETMRHIGKPNAAGELAKHIIGLCKANK